MATSTRTYAGKYTYLCGQVHVLIPQGVFPLNLFGKSFSLTYSNLNSFVRSIIEHMENNKSVL